MVRQWSFSSGEHDHHYLNSSSRKHCEAYRRGTMYRALPQTKRQNLKLSVSLLVFSGLRSFVPDRKSCARTVHGDSFQLHREFGPKPFHLYYPVFCVACSLSLFFRDQPLLLMEMKRRRKGLVCTATKRDYDCGEGSFSIAFAVP